MSRSIASNRAIMGARRPVLKRTKRELEKIGRPGELECQAFGAALLRLLRS
jgi:hypothetical protein